MQDLLGDRGNQGEQVYNGILGVQGQISWWVVGGDGLFYCNIKEGPKVKDLNISFPVPEADSLAQPRLDPTFGWWGPSPPMLGSTSDHV